MPGADSQDPQYRGCATVPPHDPLWGVRAAAPAMSLRRAVSLASVVAAFALLAVILYTATLIDRLVA